MPPTKNVLPGATTPFTPTVTMLLLLWLLHVTFASPCVGIQRVTDSKIHRWMFPVKALYHNKICDEGPLSHNVSFCLLILTVHLLLHSYNDLLPLQ